MTAKTRLGYEGYGVKRASSFAAKTPDTSGGPHPVSIITRLGLDGYGVRRYRSFAGKTQTSPLIIVPANVAGGRPRRTKAERLHEAQQRREVERQQHAHKIAFREKLRDAVFPPTKPHIEPTFEIPDPILGTAILAKTASMRNQLAADDDDLAIMLLLTS